MDNKVSSLIVSIDNPICFRYFCNRLSQCKNNGLPQNYYHYCCFVVLLRIKGPTKYQLFKCNIMNILLMAWHRFKVPEFSVLGLTQPSSST